MVLVGAAVRGLDRRVDRVTVNRGRSRLKGRAMKSWTLLPLVFLLASATASQAEDAVLLTPSPGPRPKINGPKVYACGPKHPLLYRIPATGQRPMQFTAAGLPAGLAIDPATGIIRGAIAEKGEYRVTLAAQNGQGRAERPL